MLNFPSMASLVETDSPGLPMGLIKDLACYSLKFRGYRMDLVQPSNIHQNAYALIAV